MITVGWQSPGSQLFCFWGLWCPFGVHSRHLPERSRLLSNGPGKVGTPHSHFQVRKSSTSIKYRYSHSANLMTSFRRQAKNQFPRHSQILKTDLLWQEFLLSLKLRCPAYPGGIFPPEALIAFNWKPEKFFLIHFASPFSQAFYQDVDLNVNRLPMASY